MYNEKVEGLIKAALADGELTEKEKQILFRKAEAEGIDLDEFEMVLDARLVELKKEEKSKVQSSAPKSDKFGDVRKCPVCGAILQSFQHKCDDCGYEFRNVEAVESAQKLFDLLQAAELRKTQKLQEYEQAKVRKLNEFDREKDDRLQELSKRHSSDSGIVKILGGQKRLAAQNEERDDLIATMERSRAELVKTLDRDAEAIEEQSSKEKYTIIKNFPVPNAKEDLLELLAMSTSSAYDNDGVIGGEEEVWIQKTDQIYQKILACAGNDTAFVDQASTMVISLMRRLPMRYKQFTQLPERAKSKLKEEMESARNTKIEIYKSVFKIAGPICLGLIVLGVIGILTYVDALTFGGFIGAILTLFIATKIVKKKLEFK